jgi:F-type H+-transporting ATPase subunit delta
MYSKGQTIADVWSAYKLSNDFCLKLEKLLSTIVGKKVSLNVHLDPSLLGGTVIEVDGFRLDNSILGNLEQLSYHMKGAR